jgi:1-deoxy-D-xylulose-5-phosphate reductoisomerase
MKKVAVLGATGSIGRNALDVIRADGDCFELVLFSANSNADALPTLAVEFSGARVAFTGRLAGLDGCGKQLYVGCNGILGATGLESSLAALESESALAMANKKSMVMAGALVLKTAADHSLPVIPVDSEHSAVFQLLRGREKGTLKEILLTALCARVLDRDWSGAAGDLRAIKETGRLAREAAVNEAFT